MLLPWEPRTVRTRGSQFGVDVGRDFAERHCLENEARGVRVNTLQSFWAHLDHVRALCQGDRTGFAVDDSFLEKQG